MLKRSGAFFFAFSLAFLSCRTMPLSIEGNRQGYVKTPGQSLAFWREVMTPTVAERYRARGTSSYCNVFLADTLRDFFGPAVYGRVLPEGLKSPSVLYREWQRNPDLVALDPEDYSLGEIQDLADQGFVVLLAYYYSKGKSHVAFVGNSGLDLFTVPAISKMEGKNGSDLSADWLPIVVQAGTFAGVTSAAYATNGWFSSSIHPFDGRIVQFYLIKT